MARTLSGNPRYGRNVIGGRHDTAGARKLIELIDGGSPERPLNISLWGGQTDLAPALWRVKQDRGADGLVRFARKFRALDVNDQDEIADWMRAEFPALHYTISRWRLDFQRDFAQRMQWCLPETAPARNP